jgi:hypothetical protein
MARTLRLDRRPSISSGRFTQDPNGAVAGFSSGVLFDYVVVAKGYIGCLQ